MVAIRKVKKNQIILSLLGVLAVSLGVAWYIRANSWPCGRFDSTSGCVSSVKLQVDALQFEDGTVHVNYKSFDLSSGAEIALVGLQGIRVEQQNEERYYAILALFDVEDGRLIQVLRELKGARQKVSNVEDGRFLSEYKRVPKDYSALTGAVALSPDGSLAASYAYGENENSAIVQRTTDSSIVKTIHTKREQGSKKDKNACTTWRNCCRIALDFSPDNQSLQCDSIVYQIESGRQRSLVSNGKYIYPMISDFSAGPFATASDGTHADNSIAHLFVQDHLTPEQREAELKRYAETNTFRLIVSGAAPQLIYSPLELFDANQDFMFSPNSQSLLEGYVAYHQNRGKRLFTPSPFRRLSAIAIWTRNAELKRMFFTNKRYRGLAWSRDSKYYTLLNRNLTLQVFKAP